jgi:hypothetical protein
MDSGWKKAAQIQSGKEVIQLKKVLLSVTGIALIVLLLAALGGVVLASGKEPAPVDVIEEQVSDDLAEVVSESAGVKKAPGTKEAVEPLAVENLPSQEQVVDQEILTDDDPEDEHPEGESAEGGCGGYADPVKFAAKIDAAAEFLGMTPEEVAAQVQAGKRLYEIAAEQGADVDAFKEAVHAAVDEVGGCGCGSH